MECSAGLVFFMQEVMRLKKTSQTTDLVLALFLYIPVIWAALLIAQSLGGGLPELLKLNCRAGTAFPDPMDRQKPVVHSVCTGAYLMGLCLYASRQGRTRDGEEHGSAAWGSPRQLNAQFRQKQNKILLQAIILMLFQEAPESEQNFSMVMRVLEYAEVKEDDEDHVSPLDLLFSAIEREKPDSVAVRQYKVFKMAAGKTSKSILVSPLCVWPPLTCPRSGPSRTTTIWICTRWERRNVPCTLLSRTMTIPITFW